MESERIRSEKTLENGYSRLGASQATRRLLSQIGVYGVGNALQRLGAFVLLPLYIARLTPEEYGVLTLASLVPFVLPPILSLGLHTPSLATITNGSETEWLRETWECCG